MCPRPPRAGPPAPSTPGEMVKKIEAFIRHEALEAIHDGLLARGLPSMSVSEAKGSGRQAGFTEQYRGSRRSVFLRPKLKLEVAVDDADLERAVDCILEHAHTGAPGDGKIFVYDIVEAIRVRTGERGPIVLASHTD